MLNLTRLHLGIAHESQFQGLGIRGTTYAKCEFGGSSYRCSAAQPVAVRAQQAERMRQIGVLMGYAESDSDARAWYTAFREALQKLGWTEGRNIQVGTRWARPDDASRRPKKPTVGNFPACCAQTIRESRDCSTRWPVAPTKRYSMPSWRHCQAGSVANGRWWVHVRFCSVRCEGIYEVKRKDAAKLHWHAVLARGNSHS
jgi:hypothetical protein